MSTITLSDMESKLLTVEQVTQKLQQTEPLDVKRIDNASRIRFRVPADWAHGIEAIAPTDTVGVEMAVDGTSRPMTKEAFFQAGANFGLTSSYLRKLPANLAEGLLNYHYGNGMGTEAFSLLNVDDRVSAFTRPTLESYSNLQLFDQIVSGIEARHPGMPVYADYKMANSLLRTDVRIITPAVDRHMRGTGMDDVPTNGDDTWMAGIHLSNSLIGKTQTAVEAYLFRWWCTNGATTTVNPNGAWNRRSGGGDSGDVYEWARRSVDEVLGGMDALFDQVQALANLSLDGQSTADVLREIFAQFEVPVSQREAITRRLLAVENLTMYTIMAAITEAANESDLEDRRRDRLMRIGGELPTTTFDTLKARVWREGHLADPDQRNPYEPLLIA